MPRAKRVKPFAVIDSETDPFHNCADELCPKCCGLGRVPRPFLWGFFDGETYLEFETIPELVSHLEKLKIVVYAHNGGKFDYQFLREYINADEPITIINGRLAKFRIGECEFRDSLNIFPNTALADFGGKIDIDYNKMEVDARKDPNNLAEIKRYLRQDCVLLYEQVARYRKEYGTGLTQAGTALKVWSKMANREPPRQTQAQHDLYRPYYYGGRVECFVAGAKKANFKIVDKNSAYPDAMTHCHLISPSGVVRDTLPADDQIQFCLITLDCVSRGIFPFRTKDHELLFPDDGAVRTYHVTGWEMLTALEMGAIHKIKIHQVHHFEEHIDFKDYIDHFYNQRMIAKRIDDKAGVIFGKYFMNGTYGKLGASPSHRLASGEMFENYMEYVISTDDSFIEHQSDGYDFLKSFGQASQRHPDGRVERYDRYLMQRPLQEEKKFFYNIATAASITGYVRAGMYRALVQSSQPLYCDTDGIAALDVSRLPTGPELGLWKLEMNCDEYAIAGKKFYAFHNAVAPYDLENPEWKVACKGVDLTAQEIIRVAQGESIDYLPEAPTFSSMRVEPKFIGRTVRKTAKILNRMTLAPNV